MRVYVDAPTLNTENLVLRPFDREEDFDYLFELASKYKYNTLELDKMKEIVHQYGVMFWNVIEKNLLVRGGVIYLTYVPNLGYSLDAYRDETLAHAVISTSPTKDYSYQAGKIVIEYALTELSPHLFTMHRVENRGATIISKRLGFKTLREVDSAMGRFIILKKSKEKEI